MKFTSTIKKTSIAAVLALALVASVGAFGLSHASAESYNGADTQPTAVPTFNSITGTPYSGDEPDFYRGKVATNETPINPFDGYTDPLNDACKTGTVYTYRVYVHNNASDLKKDNDNGNGPSVAHNTKVKVNLPTKANTKFVSTATISASNAATVNDTMTLNCGGNEVTLNYVAGSASQYSGHSGDKALSDSIVTTGASIGTVTPNGDMWGCWDQRVWVTFEVVVKKVTPPAPAYKCDVLTVTKQSDRKYDFTVNYTQKNGAEFKNATFDFGDGTTPLTTTDTTVSHTYAKDGNYNAKVSVTFTANDKDYTVTGNDCAAPVAINQPQTPTELPSTGPGSTVAIFAGVAIIAAGTHYFIRRRFNS